MKNERTRKQSVENQRLMLAIGIVVLVLLGSFLIKGVGLQRRCDYYRERLENLDTQIEEEKERRKSIEEEQEYMQTDEYIEKIAREKLGLVKENETVFVEVE